MVPSQSLEGLKQWAVKMHGHLFEGNSPKSQSEDGVALPCSLRVCKEILDPLCYVLLMTVHAGLVCFKTSQELGVDSVVHFRAKLVALVSSRGKQHSMLSEVNHSKCHSYLGVFFFDAHSCGGR